MLSKTTYGLPLLAKELIEQATRKRTYVLRTIYACLLFGFALVFFWGFVYARTSSVFEMLGTGRQLFELLLILQIIGVLLFTPALTCGAITSEKERNTIGLLFLTKLGPWTIILEKYLGRLLIMGSYLLISLPLFGFCYALGGLEQLQVWFGTYGLLITLCQLSALGLCCSSYFKTTVAAFIATYLIGILIFFGPILLQDILSGPTRVFLEGVIWNPVRFISDTCGLIGTSALNGLGQLLGAEDDYFIDWKFDWQLITYHFQAEIGYFWFVPGLMYAASNSPFPPATAWQRISLGFPAIGSTFIFLILARWFLVRRAFVSSKRYLLRFFQLVDRLFHRANQNRVTKGIILIPVSGSLPDVEPISWRETTKSSLGSVRYLIRIFLAMELPVITICLLAVISNPTSFNYYSGRHWAISAVNLMCWVVAILLIVVKSATLVSGERSHETLEVLLTTPISARQFVREKFKGVLRLMLVVAVPLMTGIYMQAWFCSVSANGWLIDVNHTFGAGTLDRIAIAYLLASICTILLTLPLLAWIGLWIGMWMKTSTRAILMTLALLLAWCFLPVLLLVSLFEMLHIPRGDPLTLLLLCSPLVMPVSLEIGDLGHFGNFDLVAIGLYLFFYAGLLWVIRTGCLLTAANLLGRSEDAWR